MRSSLTVDCTQMQWTTCTDDPACLDETAATATGPQQQRVRQGRRPKLWISDAVCEEVCKYCNKKLAVKNTTKIKKVSMLVPTYIHDNIHHSRRNAIDTDMHGPLLGSWMDACMGAK